MATKAGEGLTKDAIINLVLDVLGNNKKMRTHATYMQAQILLDKVPVTDELIAKLRACKVGLQDIHFIINYRISYEQIKYSRKKKKKTKIAITSVNLSKLRVPTKLI